MTHRRYIPLPAPKPEAFDRPPLRNNEARLKHIYEAQLVFKDKPKEPYFRKSLNKSTQRKQIEELPEPKFKTPIQQLNLADIKQNQRYRQHQKQSHRERLHVYRSNDQNKGRYRYAKEPAVLTSRNGDESTSRHRDEPVTDRSENYKIRRKSISGSLKKKLKEQQNAQYLSANPVLPSELNYYEQARKLYKQGKMSEALRLFQLTMEKEPQMADACYYAALCLLSKHQYQKAFDLLSRILEKFQNCKRKTVYLFAGISAKNLGHLDKAITLVSRGIQKYPDYADLFLYRAKLEQEQKDYESALQDYETVLKTQKDNPEVLLKAALCYKSIGKMSNCLSMLNSAFYSDRDNEYKSKILIQRIKIYFDNKKLKDCKKDLHKLQELQNENCEMNYYKGLVQLAEQNKKGALLSFEKCIRNNSNTNGEAVARSLVEISKSKIEDRDFYSALYHINRASYLGVTSEDIEKFKLFAEGVVFLMKRKINEGVNNLNQLQEKYKLGPYFDPLFYLYRAFGHFMQNKHQQAIQDYLMAEKFISKDKHINYNQLLAEGIVKVNNKDFEGALNKFDEAQNAISTGNPTMKIEPFIYRAMTFTEKIKTNISINKSDELQTLEEIFIALKELDKAYDINDSNSNMLYLRSLIYMYLGKTDDGLQDIIKAISKSEENVAKYFFFRALAHETLGNSKQALNDFNICINLDEKHSRAYLERAKLFFSNEQTAKGLQDLKKYSDLQPNSDQKIIEFCLFYISKEYDLAENCLEDIQDEAKRKELEIYLDFKQLRITEVKSKLVSQTDQMICDIIMGEWHSQEFGVDDAAFFNRMEYHCFMGIKYFNIGQFDEAINQFSIAIKEKNLMDLEESVQNSTEEDSPDSQDLLEISIDIETKQNQLHYMNYNLFVSYLANSDKKKAYEIFVRDLLPAKESFLRSQTVGSISRLLFQALKSSESEVSSQKEVFQFVLFRSMLGENSDSLDIELPNFILRTKLCYPMPYAKKIYSEYSAKINPSFILECLKISEVENRPQPPWVKRKNQDLIFTDEVRNINVEFQTTEHDEQNQEDEDYDQEEDEEGEQEEGETVREDRVESEQTPFDPRKFKEQMRLDDDIERKLKKIMEGKKKNQ